jgi:hypothetical protein
MMCGAMGRIERIGDFDAQIDQSRYVHWLSANALPQRPAFQQFHRDEVLAFMFPYVMDCADIRVVQNGRGPRFTQEPFDGRSIPADFRRKKLQSNVAAQTCVFGFVHHAHSAAPKLLDHTIMRHCLANHVPAILADTGLRLAGGFPRCNLSA